MINPHSLHVRLIYWHTMLLGVVMIGFGAYTYISMEHYLVSSLQAVLERRVKQIAFDIQDGLPRHGQAVLIADIKRRYAPEVNDRFIRITRSDGNVVYVSGDPKDQSFDPHAISRISSDVSAQRREAGLGGNHIYIAAANVRSDIGGGITYRVETGESDRQIRAALQGFLQALALGFPVPLILTAFVAYFLVERALFPVAVVMRAAEDITLKNLSRRLPVPPTGDKLEHLTRALNRMIARLDDAFQQASRFTADASHELRTPLTIMRGELEQLVQRADLSQDARECVVSVLEEAERLSRIVEDLLAIARLEAGEARLEQQLIDLGTLAATTAEQMKLLADEKRIALTVHAKPAVYIEGDPSRIKQVIVNLIDNAIKFTGYGGNVELTVSSEGGQAVLRVDDDGAGISDEDLPHIFERFYRADKMRRRCASGVGLGLSIVHFICVAHAGAVRAERSPKGGSRFVVTLALASREAERKVKEYAQRKMALPPEEIKFH